MYDDVIAENEATANEKSQQHFTDKTKFEVLNLPLYDFRRPKTSSKRSPGSGKRKKKATRESDDPYFTTMSGPLIEKKIDYLKFIDKECERCLDCLHDNGIFIVSRESLLRVYRTPKENPDKKSILYLSSSRSTFPFTHPINVSYRKNQRKVLKKLGRQSEQNSRLEKMMSESPDVVEDQQGATPKKQFLPQVASFADITREGRRKRRQIENARPSPYWPQHLLDKLCLCMDDCHVGNDRKEIVFNYVKH